MEPSWKARLEIETEPPGLEDTVLGSSTHGAELRDLWNAVFQVARNPALALSRNVSKTIGFSMVFACSGIWVQNVSNAFSMKLLKMASGKGGIA